MVWVGRVLTDYSALTPATHQLRLPRAPPTRDEAPPAQGSLFQHLTAM